MKIYRITAYDNAFSYHFRPTRKAAEKLARELRAEYHDSEFDSATVEVEPLEVAPTRAGIAEALQDFVDSTCFNEH